MSVTDCKAGTLNFPSHACLCTCLQITIYHQDVASSHVLFNFWAFGSSPAKNPGKAHSPPVSPALQPAQLFLSFLRVAHPVQDPGTQSPPPCHPRHIHWKKLKQNGDTVGTRHGLLWCRFTERTVESCPEATAVEPRTKGTSRTD